MIKILSKNFRFFLKVKNLAVLGKFVEYDISMLNSINSDSGFTSVIHQVVMSNGTFKSTGMDRFTEIDEYVIETLLSNHNVEINVHDVACSDGSSSTVFYDKLCSIAQQVNLTTSDYYSKIFKESSTFFDHFYDERKKWIFGHFFGFLLINPRLSNYFILSKILSFFFTRRKISEVSQDILLICPSLMRLLKSNSAKHLSYNIFERFPNKEKFNIIRCMNILNRVYFSEELVKKALENLLETLADDGILIIGRTDIATNNQLASIYKKRGNKLEIVHEFGSGFEFSYLIG